jgi:hypothetical protein
MENATSQTPNQTPPSQEQKPIEPFTASPPPKKSRKLKSKLPFLVIAVLLILLILFGGYFVLNQTQKAEPTPTPSPIPVACTQEAKLCPDGKTYVSRQGPKCEFAPCPAGKSNSNSGEISDWKTYSNTSPSWQIKHPADLQPKTELYTQFMAVGKGVGQAVTFSKYGSTQRTETELYDGFSLGIATAVKDRNTTLKNFADNETKPNPEIGSTREYIVETTVNGIKGYEAHVTGLGKNRYIFFSDPKDNTKVIRFFIISEGPNKADNDMIINQMLSTFKLTQ